MNLCLILNESEMASRLARSVAADGFDVQSVRIGLTDDGSDGTSVTAIVDLNTHPVEVAHLDKAAPVDEEDEYDEDDVISLGPNADPLHPARDGKIDR